MSAPKPWIYVTVAAMCLGAAGTLLAFDRNVWAALAALVFVALALWFNKASEQA